ncbi:MAG: hypothetical protein AABW81_02115, partial [Nanoarchaeota archaeon]
DYDIAIINLKNHYEKSFNNTHISKYLKENNPKITTILLCYLLKGNPVYIETLENYDEIINFGVGEDNISKLKVLIEKGEKVKWKKEI